MLLIQIQVQVFHTADKADHAPAVVQMKDRAAGSKCSKVPFHERESEAHSQALRLRFSADFALS